MKIFGDDVDPDDNFDDVGPDFPDYFRISHLLEQWSIAQLGTPSHLYDFCNIHQYFWTRFTVTPNNENVADVLKCYSIRVQVVFISFRIEKPTIQAYTGLETDQLVLQVYKKKPQCNKDDDDDTGKCGPK